MIRARTALALGPALSGLSFAVAIAVGQTVPFAWVMALTALVATWWILEPIPAPVTGLIPLGLLPALGILTPTEVAEAFGNPLILLLAGGFMLSQALSHNGAHRRLAFWMITLTGAKSGRQLLLGFILAAALISMWMSNTATTLMLMPVALAILERYPDPRLRLPLVLGIAYAASLGGLGTPIGTPPNLVFMQVYATTTGSPISFLQWMAIGVPIVAISLPLLWLWLGRNLAGTPAARVPPLGPIATAERRVLIGFAIIALLWVFRSDPYGGWASFVGMPKINDASIALLGVVALCLCPNGRGGRLLSWEAAESIPWGVLLVFAGGIALAQGFENTGVSAWMATFLSGLTDLPLWLLILLLGIGVTLLSEIASNTATAVLLMPVLAVAAKASGVDPALLMLPAALAASLGFMLPVATAPNTVAYGTGLVQTREMVREGWVVDLIGIVAMTVVVVIAFR